MSDPRRLTPIGVGLLLLAAGAAAHAANDHDAWAVRFFPQAREWAAFDALPAFDVRDPRRAAALRDAHAAARIREEDGGAPAPVERRFEELDPASFRVIDLDRDGTDDVVYSGPAPWREGHTTLVWYGSAAGFRAGGKDVLSHASNILALRIRPGAEPGLVSVRVGCCAAPEDEYLAGNFFNPYRDGTVVVPKDLAPPAEAADRTRATFTNAGETVLRREPAVSDAYDEDASAFLDAAVFGNVLAKYLRGARGEVVATQRDGAGREWVLVVMSRDSAPLRHHEPYAATAGWVLAGVDFRRVAPPFAPDRFPAGSFTVTSAEYAHGDVVVRVRQARPAGRPVLTKVFCSVSLEVRHRESGRETWRLEQDIEPVGGSYGLFVPDDQPLAGRWLVVKEGDYDGRLFVVARDGAVQDLPGGPLLVDRSLGVLFSESSGASESPGYVALDLRTGRVLDEGRDWAVCGWYRKDGTIVAQPCGEGDTGPAKDVAYVWDARQRRMAKRAVRPSFFDGAAPVPYDFDPRGFADCVSPTSSRPRRQDGH